MVGGRAHANVRPGLGTESLGDKKLGGGLLRFLCADQSVKYGSDLGSATGAANPSVTVESNE
jgi:hypothetical protein